MGKSPFIEICLSVDAYITSVFLAACTEENCSAALFNEIKASRHKRYLISFHLFH